MPLLKPTFLFDAANSRQLPARVTFTRASGGSYFDRLGVLRQAAANQPRFDFDPVTLACRGLLIEEQRTNILIYSEDHSDAVWSVRTNASITTGVADPFGGTQAFTITATAASGVWGQPRSGGTVGQIYTSSLWIRRRTGTGGVSLYAGDNVGISITAELAAAAGRWVQIARTGTPITSVNIRHYVAITNSGDEIDIAFSQLELGSFATSYIPTGAATATRSADVVLISGTAYSDIASGSEISVVASGSAIYAAGVSVNHGLATFSDGTQDNRFNIRLKTALSGTGNAVAQGGVFLGQRFSATAPVNNRVYTVASRLKESDYRFFADGTEMTGGTLVAGTLPTTMNRLYLGVGSNGAAEFLNGWLRTIAVYRGLLTDAELQALSA
jgi:hypothetical protein